MLSVKSNIILKSTFTLITSFVYDSIGESVPL